MKLCFYCNLLFPAMTISQYLFDTKVNLVPHKTSQGTPHSVRSEHQNVHSCNQHNLFHPASQSASFDGLMSLDKGNKELTVIAAKRLCPREISSNC